MDSIFFYGFSMFFYGFSRVKRSYIVVFSHRGVVFFKKALFCLCEDRKCFFD